MSDSDTSEQSTVPDKIGEYNVLDDAVRFVFSKGMLQLTVANRFWTFPITDLSNDDIMYIHEIIETKKSQVNRVPPNSCGGCITIPSNGFGSHKFNWCRFSRTIARLQEQYYHKLLDTPTN